MGLLAALPVLWGEILRLLSGAEADWVGLAARAFFCAIVLAWAWLGQPRPAPGGWQMPRLGLIGLAAAVGAVLLAGATGSTAAAWVATAGWMVALLWLARPLGARGPLWRRAGLVVGLALLAGAGVALAAQVEAGFAEEEFFVALQALGLAVAWALLLAALARLSAAVRPPALGALTIPPLALRLTLIAGGLLLLVGAGAAVGAYQASFSPPPGSAAQPDAPPFRCAQIAPAAQSYDGAEVQARQLALLAAHPQKAAPEYAALALGTGAESWAAQFREQLLAEAEQGLFTAAAGSVKYGQYEAAFRVFYYDRMRAAFPDLFSPADEARLRDWFAAINRRALTVEWVDYLYALAFGQAPAGPYENQEIGAGLLAVLEHTGLADPQLSAQNQAYLARRPGGWAERTRNSDDTYIYQLDWLTSAYFRSLAAGGPPPLELRRSLEWLMLQMPPDGSPLSYNFPIPITPDGAALLGAQLLDDPRYIWFAGRALEGSAAYHGFTRPQPGADGPLSGAGEPPTEGSCLIFGDTGLPTRAGPLAPDKIVFRDGWSPGDQYALLNLRFSGWHRYKATNTLTLVACDGALLADQQAGAALPWLPRGRSVVRDKRLPREALNGLIIPRSGMSAVAQQLSGLGGPWAQDPPPYARVAEFVLREDSEISTTVIDDWRGWSHSREVRFYHDGPIVVLDTAEGPATQRAALAWNLPAGGALAGAEVALREGDSPARLVMVPLDGGTIGQTPAGADGSHVRYTARAGGRLGLASVILSGAWATASVEIVADEWPTLRISAGERSVEVPLPAGYWSQDQP